jgi:hypothetical protein
MAGAAISRHCEIRKYDGSSEVFAKNKPFREGRRRRKSVSGSACLDNPDVVIDKTTPNASPNVEPKSASAQGAALFIEGVPPGSDVWLDNQAYTATAQSGKVDLRNIPHGEHHLRLLLHSFQYYDRFIDLKPGQIIKIETHMSANVPTPPPEVGVNCAEKHPRAGLRKPI